MLHLQSGSATGVCQLVAPSALPVALQQNLLLPLLVFMDRSVGCIMAELLGRRALFAGKDQYDQLRRIIRICGSPSESDLSFLLSAKLEEAPGGKPTKRRMKINRQFIDQLPHSDVGSTESLLFWISLCPILVPCTHPRFACEHILCMLAYNKYTG